MKSSAEEDLEQTTSPSLSYIKRMKEDWDENPHLSSKLVLYYRPDCHYCIRVLDYLNKINKSVSLKDTKQDDLAKDELLSIGGKTQVPCLVIDGQALYESLDIIRWISENKDAIPAY